MAIVLPLLAIGAWSAALRRRLGWRRALLAALTIGGAFAALSLEVLSLGLLVVQPVLIVAWLMLAGAGGYVLWLRRHMPVLADREASALRRLDILVLALAAVIAGGVGVVALAAPPNTWDSMTYHMPRVMHWMQSQSVAHYVTPERRQLALGPGAEMLILHAQLLAGSDRFANLVQWLSLLGCALAASLIASQAGGSARSQVVAAALVVAAPTAVLQGSTTQNDLVVALWLMAAAVFVIDLMRPATHSPTLAALLAAAAGGLAMLTKGTALALGVPIGVAVLVWLLRRRSPRAMGLVAAMAGIILLLNTGQFTRNWQTFGDPLGVDTGHYGNQLYTPAAVLSNTVRHAGTHLGALPWTLRFGATDAVKWLHELIGLEINDPRISLKPQPFHVRAVSYNEDLDGNTLHLFLAVFALALLLARPALRGNCVLVGYALAVAGAGLVFVIVFKWQPWIARLHTPLFVAACPFIAVTAVSWIGRRGAAALAIAALLLVTPWLIWNQGKPLVGPVSIFNLPRQLQYFRFHPQLAPDYVALAEAVASRQPATIGLLSDAEQDPWEYPLWVLLRDRLPEVYIYHLRGFGEEHAAQATPDVAVQLTPTLQAFDPRAR